MVWGREKLLEIFIYGEPFSVLRGRGMKLGTTHTPLPEGRITGLNNQNGVVGHWHLPGSCTSKLFFFSWGMVGGGACKTLHGRPTSAAASNILAIRLVFLTLSPVRGRIGGNSHAHGPPGLGKDKLPRADEGLMLSPEPLDFLPFGQTISVATDRFG